MAFVTNFNILTKRLLKLSIQTTTFQTREFQNRKLKIKHPHWFLKKQRVVNDDFITADNKQFIKEVVQERLESTAKENNAVKFLDSPLKDEISQYAEWSPGIRRTGVIARKLGEYPMWTSTGQKFTSTLLQIVDNHVVKYLPPEDTSRFVREKNKPKNPLGCLIIGAETADPSFLTKDYCGIFDKSGVLPKKNICRFYVSPKGALPPGTPLHVTHYRVGDFIDVRGKTIGRGFQGVMKRWGFKGMPATHGVTKTHRRPGNIGGGGEKGRVWPGTKLPGHMGFKWRVLRGLEILRIDTKNNVLWVRSTSVPGPVGGLCYLFDTLMKSKKMKTAPPFPTHVQTGEEPEEFLLEKIHDFSAPTINFPE